MPTNPHTQSVQQRSVRPPQRNQSQRNQPPVQTKQGVDSANLLQRAQAAPSSLTPSDVLQLQRTVGNRATLGLLSKSTPLQAKLKVGPASDQYEQEADRVSHQVMRQINGAPLVQRQEKHNKAEDNKAEAKAEETIQTQGAVPISRVQRVAAPQQQVAQREPQHGLEGGDVDPSVASQIQSVRGGGGHSLDNKVRGSMEQGFGVDFGNVRVHTDSQSHALNRSLNANAFTTGSDIFFGKGQYNPGSSSGQKLIAHELTHTVQQGATTVRRDAQTPVTLNHSAQPGVVQHDIGFEFESQQMLTKKSNTGALPAVAFADENAANATFNPRTSTRIPKGDALLSKPDIEVQADDSAMGGNSDLEVVTTHFPLDDGGRGRLDQAMTDVDALVNAYPAFSDPAGDIAPASALGGVGGFHLDMNDGMFLGKFHRAKTAGQVTFGIRAGNIGDIVTDLHGDPNETNVEKGQRDPGRLRMRPANNLNVNEPRQLAQGTEANTLVSGHTLAKNTLQQYCIDHPNSPGGHALEGLLTIIFSYTEAMQHKQSFLKNHTPLMAKTNMATLFATLPPAVTRYYSRKRHGKSNLERLVASAPGYHGKMNQALFHGVDAGQENIGNAPRQWYHKLKLKDWLRAMVLKDRPFFDKVKEGFAGPAQRPGKDKLTNSAFPKKPQQANVEGYGALGQNMDTDTVTGEHLPVFELRSASRLITYAEAHTWALELFDYIRSVNETPGGNHVRIV